MSQSAVGVTGDSSVEQRILGMLRDLAETYEATARELNAETPYWRPPSDDVLEHRAMARLLHETACDLERQLPTNELVVS